MLVAGELFEVPPADQVVCYAVDSPPQHLHGPIRVSGHRLIKSFPTCDGDGGERPSSLVGYIGRRFCTLTYPGLLTLEEKVQ